MHIAPYLHFDGDCAEAFKFYADLLGGEVDMMMTFGEAPPMEGAPAEWQDKVVHVHMKAPNGFTLMGTDAPPAYFKTPQGFSVSLAVDSPAEAERIYKALAHGAQAISMELQKTFFAEKFAMLTDRFGIPWVVNCPPAAT
jgi:PhnB protein